MFYHFQTKALFTGMISSDIFCLEMVFAFFKDIARGTSHIIFSLTSDGQCHIIVVWVLASHFSSVTNKLCDIGKVTQNF